MKIVSIELTDDTLCESDRLWWKHLMSLFLKPGRQFEIRHWREESEIIEKAERLGMISDRDSTDFEVSVKGILTSSVIDEILNPDFCLQNDQMTQFFSINITDNLSCSHYGKELYVFDPSEEICRQLFLILEPIKEYFTFEQYVAR